MEIKAFIRGLSIGLGGCLLLVTASPALSQSEARDVTNNLPNELKQMEARNRGSRSCPPPLQTRWKALYSGGGFPWRDPVDNPIVGTRQFGDATSINKLLSHTFKTESLKRGCCYIPPRGRAYLFVQGASSPANHDLLRGDVPNNDRFITLGSGSMYGTPGGVSAAPYGTPYPTSWRWWGRPVSPVNVNSNNRFSYAIGDDLKIRQTVLYTQTCCIVEERPRQDHSTARTINNSANAFRQLMQKDGPRNRVPMGNPSRAIHTPRVLQ